MNEQEWLSARLAEAGVAWADHCGCGAPSIGVFTVESYWKDKGGHVRTSRGTGTYCAEHLALAHARSGRLAYLRCELSPTPPPETIGYECCTLCPR